MAKVKLGDKNRVTLPADMIPNGVERFELEKDPRGRIILTPLLEVPADQAWFWSRKWQKGEREVEEHARAGRVKEGSVREIMREIHYKSRKR